MKRLILLFGLFLSFSIFASPLYAQGFLNRIKNKVERKVEDKVLDKVDEAIDGDNDRNNGSSPGLSRGNSSGNNSSRMKNNKGGGLIVSAPDVNENIAEAEVSFNSRDYSGARYAIRQAIIGVEMEIGEDVLNSMPASVSGLSKVEESDNVTSTGIGFVGLTIQREYSSSDRQLNVTVANNSALMAAVNMYASANYASSSQEQSHKQVKVQGFKGVLEYDDYSGYKLSIPLGQTSVFMLEGVNFESEPQLMEAAEKFDIEGIKTKLGEQ